MMLKPKVNLGTANHDSIRSEVFRTLNSIGHSGKVLLDIIGGEPRYSARTTIIDSKIQMKIDPDQGYIQPYKRLHYFLRNKGLTEPVIKLAKLLSTHEAVHTGARVENEIFGCPGNLKNHYELFLESVLQALKNKSKSVNGAGYLTNLIQDIIDDYACSKISSTDANMLFFYEQGISKGKFSKIYEAFCKLLVFTNGQKEWGKLLAEFYQNDKKVNDTVSSIIKRLHLQRGKCESLMDEKNWKNISYIMAYYLADLLEFNDQGDVIIIHDLPGGIHDVEPAPPDLSYERYLNDLPLPLYLNAEDSIWDIYWELAGKTDITAQGKLKTQDLPIIPIRYKQFNIETDDISEIDPFNPVVEYNSMEFGISDYKLSLPIPLKERMSGYPHINVGLFDKSRSMLNSIDNSNIGSTATIPWGVKSKYHYLYLGITSIIKSAYEKGILDQIEFESILFGSSTTRISGLEELKKWLSNPVFESSTNLDIETIKKSIGEEPSVFMTVSDGAIHNWAEVKEEFIKLISGHYFFHIQIGSETVMTSDLKKAGFLVVPVNSGEDLVKNMASITLEIMDKFSKRNEY